MYRGEICGIIVAILLAVFIGLYGYWAKGQISRLEVNIARKHRAMEAAIDDYWREKEAHDLLKKELSKTKRALRWAEEGRERAQRESDACRKASEHTLREVDKQLQACYNRRSW